MKDLRELPKFRDSWSYLYVEHCRVDRENKAIAVHDASGRTPVPCATLCLLMLGPGTSITHAAIRVLAETGCLVAWVGEQGVRFYANGLGETRASRNLVRQAKLCSDPDLRLKVVLKMYEMRFQEPLPSEVTLQQIRGREGARVREAYARASKETGIPWSGRSYRRDQWGATDPVNRALSSANSCLYGICHSAIVSLGYSPGLGFIHTGKQLSFVYDIADLYKVETTIPIAFQAVASGEPKLEQTVRKVCRDTFVEKRLLARIVSDIEELLLIQVKDAESTIDAQEYLDDDPAWPGGIWDPFESQEGGINHADLVCIGSTEEKSDGTHNS
ncbi:MAG: type I-E CRISPR-associated endonuclease Cas1 [Firmicutes bacterium]|jgi:CRISPR-associated protein Cas1|nr:type I-E CRISPR-associated endonuclease Cas1 [Bacillota bacterium]